MPFKSLSQPRMRLADQVYSQIMEAIQNGDIEADDRLVQEKLAEELGISRTPVREALFRLEQEGILTVAKRGGFKIRQIDKSEIREMYESRCAVEAFSARLLAQRNDKAVNDRLREIIVKAENLDEQTVRAYFEANRTVHRAIVEAAENRYLLDYFDNLWNRGSSFMVFAAIEQQASLSNSLGDHLQLIDTIETGDEALAAERMIAHITDGYQLQIGRNHSSAA